MREIVHIQAGQCGNQIGAKVGINSAIVLSFDRLLTVFQTYPFLSRPSLTKCSANLFISLGTLNELDLRQV